MRRYRVLTICVGDRVEVLSDWQSYRACRRQIVGRWGHWPDDYARLHEIFGQLEPIESYVAIVREMGLLEDKSSESEKREGH